MVGNFHYSVQYSNDAPPTVLAVSQWNANGHQQHNWGQFREKERNGGGDITPRYQIDYNQQSTWCHSGIWSIFLLAGSDGDALLMCAAKCNWWVLRFWMGEQGAVELWETTRTAAVTLVPKLTLMMKRMEGKVRWRQQWWWWHQKQWQHHWQQTQHINQIQNNQLQSYTRTTITKMTAKKTQKTQQSTIPVNNHTSTTQKHQLLFVSKRWQFFTPPLRYSCLNMSSLP